MDRVDGAREFAKLKHAGQKRKDGKTPYWHHLRQVVSNLEKLETSNADLLCAGWLHDTIEDTTTDYDALRDRFGKKIADTVSQVTKDKRLPQKSRELQYLRQLKNASLDAKIVKLCDIAANIADLENSGYEYKKRAKQVDDKLRYFSVIKSDISLHKHKLSGIDVLIQDLNNSISKYKRPPISI